MKIKRTTYDKIVRRRKWLSNIVEDLDIIIAEINEVNKKETKK